MWKFMYIDENRTLKLIIKQKAVHMTGSLFSFLRNGR